MTAIRCCLWLQAEVTDIPLGCLSYGDFNMKVYTSGSEKNMYNCIAGSKYFNKFCRSLGMTLNEMEILRVLLNNQDKYITHNEEIADYTGLTDKQIKDAIKRLKTRPYVKIETVREGLNRVRYTDLWEFCNKFDEYVDSNFKLNNNVSNVIDTMCQNDMEHLTLKYETKYETKDEVEENKMIPDEEITFQPSELEIEKLLQLV